MIGIDTNILVRFLVRDDEIQFEKAYKLIKREAAAGRKVIVNLLVLMETEWVLRSRYRLSKDRMFDVIASLLNTGDIQFEDQSSVEQALFAWKDSTAGFADCLIGAINRRIGCEATATFDEKAAKLTGFVAA